MTRSGPSFIIMFTARTVTETGYFSLTRDYNTFSLTLNGLYAMVSIRKKKKIRSPLGFFQTIFFLLLVYYTARIDLYYFFFSHVRAVLPPPPPPPIVRECARETN